MDAETASLAAAAATALVAAMTTDAWNSVKESLVALWHRAHPGRAGTIGEELEEARGIAEYAGPSDQAIQGLISEWQSRLARLLENNPSLAGELGSLLSRWQGQDSREVPAVSEVHIEARAKDNSRVNIAGRDMHIDEHQ